jgi:hypothetical protein
MVFKGGVALAAVVCIAAALAQGARADDLYQPSYRDQPGAATQEWDFVTAGAPMPKFVYYGPKLSAVYDGGGRRGQLVQDRHGEPNPVQESAEVSPRLPGFVVDQAAIDTICACPSF